jgi:hypothetical protein
MLPPMSTISGPGSVSAFLGALDYARQGVATGFQLQAEAAQQIASAGAAGEMPPVQAAVGLLEGRTQVAAAARVLAAVDRGLGALLDVRA